jgi:hypothetical protein
MGKGEIGEVQFTIYRFGQKRVALAKDELHDKSKGPEGRWWLVLFLGIKLATEGVFTLARATMKKTNLQGGVYHKILGCQEKKHQIL